MQKFSNSFLRLSGRISLRPQTFSRSCCTSTNSNIFAPTSDHVDLREMVRKWVSENLEPQANEFNREERFNMELFKQCGELGLLGITVSPDYGGSGMDAVAAVLVHEEMSYVDPGFCLSYLAHSMLFANNLMQNGSDEQRAAYLPGACDGSAIGGMCMSEPGSGSDVFGMSTEARRGTGGSWELSGNKMWITNGVVAHEKPGDLFLVYARTGSSGDPTKDISQFLVEKSFKGFSLGSHIRGKCGMRASGTAELVFDACVVPAANLVGAEGGAHMCMMRNLEIERLRLAVMSLGIAKRCIDTMNSYASDRKAFGKPIRKFGQIQRFISQSYAEYMAARCYVYNTALHTDVSKAGHRLDSDGAKLLAGEMGKNVADRAIQVLGGNGYIEEYVVERLWRDAKLLEIGGGTNEALQANMTRDLEKIEMLP
eukprot:132521_1